MEIVDAAGRFADPGDLGAEYVEPLGHDIGEDLAVIVVLGPAYGSRAGARSRAGAQLGPGPAES